MWVSFSVSGENWLSRTSQHRGRLSSCHLKLCLLQRGKEQQVLLWCSQEMYERGYGRRCSFWYPGLKPFRYWKIDIFPSNWVQAQTDNQYSVLRIGAVCVLWLPFSWSLTAEFQARRWFQTLFKGSPMSSTEEFGGLFQQTALHLPWHKKSQIWGFWLRRTVKIEQHMVAVQEHFLYTRRSCSQLSWEPSAIFILWSD